MLEISPELNTVPDLIIEDEEKLMITETNSKRKRNEVARGRRNWRKEDDISWYLGEHRTRKDSIPKTGMSLNKKKINGRCLKINPEVIEYISKSCTQHQGGGYSVSVV